jgi:spermidine/putrescine transport system ATP-binding protein
MSEIQEVLRLENIVKSFGPVTVLKDINLSVMSNEFLTILGPSGSGKTTILRLIGGFDLPSGGRILLSGKDVSGLPINRRPFNTVFQDYALFPHLSVRRNVGYGLMVRGLKGSSIGPRVDEVLKIVGLQDYATRLPHELSGGQRQRVALARAIICEPRVILLDEPLAALDVTLRAQMCRFLKGVQRRLDIAFVFITHDQQEAIAMSDRIVVMRDGKIEQIGSPEELYANPQSHFVADFFGENNFIDGKMIATKGGFCDVDTVIGTLKCRAPNPAIAIGSALHVAVRPENINLFQKPTSGYDFVVTDVQFAGASTLIETVSAKIKTLQLRIRLQAGSHAQLPKIGTAIKLNWLPEDALAVRTISENA